MTAMLKMEDVDLAGKRVLIRQDLNVPFANGEVSSAGRLKASVPTIQAALDAGARVMVMSHLGRPKEGQLDSEHSLEPVARYLSELLRRDVPLVTEATMRAMIDKLVFDGEEEGTKYVAEYNANHAVHKMDHLTCFVGGMLVLGSHGSDREDEYMKVAPTLAQDACGTCASHSTCTAAQYTAVQPTTTSDRQCNLKVCTCSGGAASTGADCPVHGTEHCQGTSPFGFVSLSHTPSRTPHHTTARG